jgi:hypothetical protein
MILSTSRTSVKVKASLLSFGSIECCLVYELIDQRNETKPIMGFHQVFTAVRVSAIPLINNHEASAAMFVARKGRFTGSKDNIKQLKRGILQEHLINNTYSFICGINGQTLRLKASFHPGRQASIEITLEETTGRVNNGSIPFK